MNRTVFVRGLTLDARIGVYASEHGRSQRIRVDVECAVPDPGGVGADALPRVVDYGAIVERVRAVVAEGHVRLVETLAERIAASVLSDERIGRVMVRVGKLDIYPDAVAGVEVVRERDG